jgi:hypothetical protein
MEQETAITVCITRTAKPGRVGKFARALHYVVQRSLPMMIGRVGVQVLRPVPGSESREHGLIRRFANAWAWVGIRAVACSVATTFWANNNKSVTINQKESTAL